MKIRLIGAPEECDTVVDAIRACPVLEVVAVSRRKPADGTRQVRVYVDVRGTDVRPGRRP